MNTNINPEKYLLASTYIDWKTPEVLKLASVLASEATTENQLVKNTFEWVRDNIKHSNEYKLNPVTCKASDVLKYKTGYCFAKSHLLAALLRANGIPTGLCYQRLSIDDKGALYSLHGLNIVYLKEHGWYRLDPRGNNKQVNAQFTPPKEQLAFSLQFEEEQDLPEVWSEPMPKVVSVLEKYDIYYDVAQNLPDI